MHFIVSYLNPSALAPAERSVRVDELVEVRRYIQNARINSATLRLTRIEKHTETSVIEMLPR